VFYVCALRVSFLLCVCPSCNAVPLPAYKTTQPRQVPRQHGAQPALQRLGEYRTRPCSPGLVIFTPHQGAVLAEALADGVCPRLEEHLMGGTSSLRRAL
jgi:hypothetical protein